MPENKKIFSPELMKLRDNLVERGILKEVLAEQHELKDVGVGSYIPKHKSIAVIASDLGAGDPVLAHEVVHGLRYSDVEPKSKKIHQHMEDFVKAVPIWQRLFNDPRKEIALPQHWVDKKMDSTVWAEWPRFGKVGIERLGEETAKRRLQEVTGAIPSYESWSGLTNEGKDEYGRNPYVEGDAHYLTRRSQLARPLKSRATEYGMYLLDYGVPMSVVEPVVRRLEGVAAPVHRYSGGSAEVGKLREQYSKFKPVNIEREELMQWR